MRPDGNLVSRHEGIRRPSAAGQDRCRIGLDLPLDLRAIAVFGANQKRDMRIAKDVLHDLGLENQEGIPIVDGIAVMTMRHGARGV